MLIHWSDADAAQAGATRIGLTIFIDPVVPNLAGVQDRFVGSVVVHHGA